LAQLGVVDLRLHCTRRHRHTLDALARRLDTPAVVLFVVALTYLAFRRFNISPYSRTPGRCCNGGACRAMLSKTTALLLFRAVRAAAGVEFTSMHDRRAGVWRWPVLTFGFLIVAATLSQYIGLRSVGALDASLWACWSLAPC